MSCGQVIIWLSGNEAYGRHTGRNLLAGVPWGDIEAVIADVLARVRQVATPVVLGPLPRIYADRRRLWEDTAAYLLDRKVREAAQDGEFLSLGKRLTKKLRGRHAVVDDCQTLFRPDGVHLSRAGYTKVCGAMSFPRWLMID